MKRIFSNFILINTRLEDSAKKLKRHAYPCVQAPPQQDLPQGFLILNSSTLLPDTVITSCHSMTVIAWYWPSSAAPREVREIIRWNRNRRHQQNSSSWPPVLPCVEQLMAHCSLNEDRCFRSSLFLLTWSLSCSDLCFTSNPESPKLQRSARPPVTSTKASDTCPAHSCSYEPWSLRWIEDRGFSSSIYNAVETKYEKIFDLNRSLTWHRLSPTGRPKRQWETDIAKNTGWL